MAPARGVSRSRTTETADAELCRPEAPLRPYLLLIGSAESGGATGCERLQPVDEALEIGRGRPKLARGSRKLGVADRCVSSAHARIARTATGFEVIDLDSRNGTFVDGRAVERQGLRDGALLFFGGFAAIFRYVTDQALSAIEQDLRAPFGPVATVSPIMALTLRRLRQLAPTPEEILLTGETGTGKEVHARAIHRASRRSGKFVGINCAAIPHELVESELFGYARGAHSQAAQAKRGLIEQAEGGTLFLDELGEMPRGAQAKLLRFLQERELLPLGSAQARRVDVRVIAATGHLEWEQQRPALRRDLLMRLGTEPIVLPPLRERAEDIGALAKHFLGPQAAAFDNRAFLGLCLHPWPGNVRELLKVVREALIYSDGKGPITLDHLPRALGDRFAVAPRERASQRRSPRQAPSRAELEQLLEQHAGSVAEVARALDRRWAVVWRIMKRHGLDPTPFRSAR
jgi:transcriptional regulator with PAS, ATPase and Fis domain